MKKIFFLILACLLSKANDDNSRPVELIVKEQQQTITITKKMTVSYFCHIVAELIQRDYPRHKVKSINGPYSIIDECPADQCNGNFTSDFTGKIVTNFIPTELDPNLSVRYGNLLALMPNALLCLGPVSIILEKKEGRS